MSNAPLGLLLHDIAHQIVSNFLLAVPVYYSIVPFSPPTRPSRAKRFALSARWESVMDSAMSNLNLVDWIP